MEPFVFGQFCFHRWSDLTFDELEYKSKILNGFQADDFWAGYQLASVTVEEGA